MFQIQHDVEIEPAHLVVKRSIDQRLAIHVHFDGSVNKLPYSHQNLIKVLPYFFGFKTEFFSFQNKPKDLDPSYKTDLDLWDGLGRVKLVL